jgi:DNA replication protein DnaC
VKQPISVKAEMDSVLKILQPLPPRKTSTPASELYLAKKSDPYAPNQIMRIPERHKGKLLETFVGHRDVVEKARVAILGGRSVSLFGDCGTGKTHMAVGLMCEFYSEMMGAAPVDIPQSFLFDRAPLFLPSIDLMMAVKAGFNTHQTEADTVDRTLGLHGLIVLDDLGSEKGSEWWRSVLYYMIDTMYRRMRQVIITTNLTKGQISEIDDRIMSRLVEMGEVITLEGKDWRVESENLRKNPGTA